MLQPNKAEEIIPDESLENETKEKRPGLNLKYLVDNTKEEKPSWFLFLFFFLLISLLGAALWLASRQEEQYFHPHQVQESENLRILAGYYYNNPREWRRIYLANREKFIQESTLKVGEQIYIPLTKEERKDFLGRLSQNKQGR